MFIIIIIIIIIIFESLCGAKAFWGILCYFLHFSSKVLSSEMIAKKSSSHGNETSVHYYVETQKTRVKQR